MKKTLLCLATLLCGFAFLSCSGDDDSDSASPASSPAAPSEKILIDAIEKYDLSVVASSLELKNYPYELQFTVSAKEGETWEASLEFDQSDKLEDDEVNCYELGSLGKASGTGAGCFSLYVYENENNANHSATLKVTSSAATVNKTVTLAQYPAAANDGEIDPKSARRRMVGYGYDYTAGYASQKCVKKQVLDVAKLCGEGVVIDYGEKLGKTTYGIDFVNFSNSVDFRELSGANTAEIELKLAAELSSGVEIGGFSAEINNHTEWTDTESTKYQYGWADISVSKYSASIEMDREDLCRHELLTNQAYKAINGLVDRYATNFEGTDGHSGIYNLINEYGPYVVVGGELGGRANVTMQVDETAITGAFDTDAMLKLAYDGFIKGSSEVQADYKKTYADNSSKFKFHSTVQGGSDESVNSLTSLLGNPNVAPGELGTASVEWKNSLSDVNNCVLLGFNDSKNQLIPIYEFVDTEEEGGEERRAAIYEYFHTKMLIDFPEDAAQGTKVKTFPSKIPLPGFDSNSNSLIKDVKLSDGVLVVRACSEYIPEIDTSKRITVIYPADNTKVYWNRGLYFGDEDHPPHSVSWVNGKVVCNPKKCEQDKTTQKYITPTAVYRFGNSFTFTEPTYLTKDYVVRDTQPAVEYQEYLGDKWRALVKIGDNIFQRDYWDYAKYNDGTSMLDVLKTRGDDFRNHDSLNNIPIRGWIQKKVGERQSTSQGNTIGGDGTYYPSELYGWFFDDHGGLFPNGWSLPFQSSMRQLVARLEAVSDKKAMGGNTAGAFLNSNILGLRIPKYGYISFYNKGSSSHFYSAEEVSSAAVFPIIDDGVYIGDPKTQRIHAHNNAIRMVLNSSGLAWGYQGLRHSGAEVNQNGDNYWYFVSPRGPCYTLLLCKSIY